MLSPESLTANAIVGIEPTLFGPEVTHSLTTGTVVPQVSGEKQHGRRFLTAVIWQEVSRACATGDVFTPGKNRMR